MDKIAAYKEWIYEGEIEKTALNAVMKRVKSLLKGGRVDAPRRIDNILDKVDRFPTLSQMPAEERIKFLKSGLKGDRSLNYRSNMSKAEGETKQMYRQKTGKDSEFGYNRRPQYDPQSWDLKKKLRANRERYNQEREAYKW